MEHWGITGYIPHGRADPRLCVDVVHDQVSVLKWATCDSAESLHLLILPVPNMKTHTPADVFTGVAISIPKREEREAYFRAELG